MTSKRSGGARWAQLRDRVLAKPEGLRAYEEGWLKANDYRDTLRILDRAREALGVSQSELARRLERRQPTVNRMLRKGTDHTLSTVDAFLRGLGLAGTLKIEKFKEAQNGVDFRMTPTLALRFGGVIVAFFQRGG